MALLNPHKADFSNFDKPTQDIFQKTIQFFEKKGLGEMKKEDHEVVWYNDFLDFLKKNQVFYNFLTPSEFGDENCRWDTARNTAFSEILGFYSLSHWYTWQVSILGLGPIWIGSNDEVKKRTAQKLKEGHVFAFGLSEKEHGADLISSDMELIPQGEGKYLARGDKYYIGNGNVAGFVSIFAKLKEKKKEYVFFVVETDHPKYECTQNVVRSQKYVAELVLHDYPITDADIVSRGRAAWDASLATVAFAKFNLGLASVGIATHSFYEAINHASARKLYGNYVTDFPHIRQLFNEAYARLVAMRMFSFRAKDYMRIASDEDRRYLLFNPLEKMKVTLEGEKVIERLWDVIAARGFEKDVYFESATRDIRMLPKLEGTVHVNMMLTVRFMNSFLFDERPVADVEASEKPHEESFLFNQGATTKGLDEIPFGPWKPKFQTASAKKAPNVVVMVEQIDTFVKFLKVAAPSSAQSKDIDFMLAVGEIFSIISYSTLILEQMEIGGPYAKDVDSDTLDQVFSVFVRDISGHAVELYEKVSATEEQQKLFLEMIRRPAHDQQREARVFEKVMALKEAYRMKP